MPPTRVGVQRQQRVRYRCDRGVQPVHRISIPACVARSDLSLRCHRARHALHVPDGVCQRSCRRLTVDGYTSSPRRRPVCRQPQCRRQHRNGPPATVSISMRAAVHIVVIVRHGSCPRTKQLWREYPQLVISLRHPRALRNSIGAVEQGIGRQRRIFHPRVGLLHRDLAETHPCIDAPISCISRIVLQVILTLVQRVAGRSRSIGQRQRDAVSAGRIDTGDQIPGVRRLG